MEGVEPIPSLGKCLLLTQSWRVMAILDQGRITAYWNQVFFLPFPGVTIWVFNTTNGARNNLTLQWGFLPLKPSTLITMPNCYGKQKINLSKDQFVLGKSGPGCNE